jgi:hypothetical protein
MSVLMQPWTGWQTGSVIALGLFAVVRFALPRIQRQLSRVSVDSVGISAQFLAVF